MPIPEPHHSPRRRTLRREAADLIREAIYAGVLKPGEALGDHELQSWLGFSRTPIREALNDLERIGLIEMSPQRYTRVFVPRPEDRVPILHSLGALLGGVASLTIPTTTGSERDELVTTFLAIEDAATATDRDALERTTAASVDLLLALCPNHILLDGVRDLAMGLLYRLAAVRDDLEIDWAAIATGSQLLVEATYENDGVKAGLLVAKIFRMPTPGAATGIQPERVEALANTSTS
ncbi:GntR family transcriptional regulator [Plantibacter flavus]|uniref:GntR family transcriptional regulator n=1 Tax=Plantibacter flavus TaxID=150123 RepID=UPI003F184058